MASDHHQYVRKAVKQGFTVEHGGRHLKVTNPLTGEYVTVSGGTHLGSAKALSAFRSRLRRLGVRGL